MEVISSINMTLQPEGDFHLHAQCSDTAFGFSLQEWQNSIQKNAGLAFIELINEGR